MKHHTAEEIMNMFEQEQVFSKNEYTFVEYVNELLRFQKATADLVVGGENTEYVRFNEVISRWGSYAREKGLSKDHRVIEGIRALNSASKSLAVQMAGKGGENRVANTFQFVTRTDADFYRNLYITNGKKETELDALVVTKNGFIVLEIKNAKEDITIAPDGRILFNNSTCYHDISIGEKMDLKRALLKGYLENKFKENSIEKNVEIDSLIVFSNPSGVKVKVHDQYKKESYCFKGGLYRRIDDYISEVEYSPEELVIINKILQTMETEQKSFAPEIDPQHLKQSFAEAYEVLSKDNADERIPIASKETSQKCTTVTSSWIKFLPKVAIAASFLTATVTTMGIAYRNIK